MKYSNNGHQDNASWLKSNSPMTKLDFRTLYIFQRFGPQRLLASLTKFLGLARCFQGISFLYEQSSSQLPPSL